MLTYHQFNAIHLRAISLEMFKISTIKTCCKITHSKLLPYLCGDSDLKSIKTLDQDDSDKTEDIFKMQCFVIFCCAMMLIAIHQGYFNANRTNQRNSVGQIHLINLLRIVIISKTKSSKKVHVYFMPYTLYTLHTVLDTNAIPIK